MQNHKSVIEHQDHHRPNHHRPNHSTPNPWHLKSQSSVLISHSHLKAQTITSPIPVTYTLQAVHINQHPPYLIHLPLQLLLVEWIVFSVYLQELEVDV